MRSTGISRSARSTTASTAPSSSISAAPSTAASTSPATRPPTRTAFAATCWSSCADLNAAARPLSRRQFRLQLQLGRRHRAAGKAPAPPRLAWKTTETNEVGTDEFIRWCRKAGTEPMLAVNLGSKGFTEALAMLEYCNHPGRQLLERSAPQERLAGAAQRQGLVPRQRDGRAVADEPPHRLRIRPHRQRGRPRHEGVRQVARARRLRLLARQHADLSRLGSRGARPSATTTSTTSRCTPIGTTGTTTT